jgi:hypothetical protein
MTSRRWVTVGADADGGDDLLVDSQVISATHGLSVGWLPADARSASAKSP